MRSGKAPRVASRVYAQGFWPLVTMAAKTLVSGVWLHPTTAGDFINPVIIAVPTSAPFAPLLPSLVSHHYLSRFIQQFSPWSVQTRGETFSPGKSLLTVNALVQPASERILPNEPYCVASRLASVSTQSLRCWAVNDVFGVIYYSSLFLFCLRLDVLVTDFFNFLRPFRLTCHRTRSVPNSFVVNTTLLCHTSACLTRRRWCVSCSLPRVHRADVS